MRMLPWKSVLATVLAAASLAPALPARGTDLISLPAPQTTGGRPLMEVLGDRHSSREFSARPLPRRVLSNLLWAACGVNRPADGKRTAPSARNWQDIDVYVAMADGLYLYDAPKHALKRILREDVRAKTGQQPFVGVAPVNLVYVSNRSRMGDAPPDAQDFYGPADTAFIAENVYLFCASEGLAVVVRGLVPRDELTKLLGLVPGQKVTLAQTVGYPAPATTPAPKPSPAPATHR